MPVTLPLSRPARNDRESLFARPPHDHRNVVFVSRDGDSAWMHAPNSRRLGINGAGVLVVNDFGTAIEFDGSRVVARPRDGLTAYRIPARAHVRSLAEGICFDRWAAALVRFQAWPRNRSGRGFFRVALALPSGLNRRSVELGVDGGLKRTVWVGPGQSKLVLIPVRGYPVPALRIRTDRADYVDGGTPNARLVAIRIPSLSYVTERSRN